MKECRAAFITQSEKQLDYVYGAGRREKIASLTDMMRETVTPLNFSSLDLSDVELLFSTWGMPVLSEEQLDAMPSLKAVFYAAGATDYFCRPMLARGIKVVSAWQANAIPVSEFVTAQIILALKNYFMLSRGLVSRGQWSSSAAGPGAYGATVSLIGAGAIAARVAGLLKNFNVNVLSIPSRPERRTVSLEEAFSRSQVVSSHLPDRDDNIGVLDGRLFRMLPRNGVFINTGRGRQVDEAGLAQVLSERPDLSAMLDVTFPEPPEKDSPLYSLPNVFLSPHIAGSLNDEVRRMADYVISDLENYISGRPMSYLVNEDMLLTSRN